MGSGSHAAVYPKGKEYRQEVIDQLNRIEGVDIYERHEIPDRLGLTDTPTVYRTTYTQTT